MIGRILLLLLVLPFTANALSVSPTTGTALSEIGLSSYSTYRLYLYVQGVDNTDTTWPITGHSTYVCGSAYGSGEGAPNNPTDARDLWDNLHGGSGPNGPAGGSCPSTVDTAGTYWVLQTDTANDNTWVSFTLNEPDEPPTATTTIYYGDWLFVNSVLIGVMAFLALGFVLSPLKK